MKNYSNLIYNRWTVIKFSHQIGSNKYWLCECSCGTVKTVCIGHLVSNKSRSCGCFQSEVVTNLNKKRIKHGKKNLPEYKIWKSMRQRCYNPKCKEYKYYGERGITICDRWLYGENNICAFDCFLNDMGRRPDPKLSIDRIKNNKGYYKKNCRWTTKKVQANNRRISVNRRKSTTQSFTSN